MTESLHELEQRVEREMALLRNLPPAEPDLRCLGSVQAAVVGEGRRVMRRRRMRGMMWTAVGAAAAILMAISLSTTSGGSGMSASDAEAALTEWTVAVDESTDRLTTLLDGGWIRSDSGTGAEDDGELDDLLRSLDQSLERFEAL